MINRTELKTKKVGDKIKINVHWKAPSKKDPNVIRKQWLEIDDAEIKEIGTQTYKWAHFKGDKDAKQKANTFYYSEELIKKSPDHFENIYDDTYVMIKVKVPGCDALKEVYIGDKGEASEEK